MSSDLNRFLNQIENLLIELINIFPDQTDIEVFIEKFKLGRQANPKKILEIFLLHVYPLKEYIMKKNEAFLLSDDINETITGNGELSKIADQDLILTKAINFKKMWEKLETTEQDMVWQYFQVLIILCERYIANSQKI